MDFDFFNLLMNIKFIFFSSFNQKEIEIVRIVLKRNQNCLNLIENTLKIKIDKTNLTLKSK